MNLNRMFSNVAILVLAFGSVQSCQTNLDGGTDMGQTNKVKPNGVNWGMFGKLNGGQGPSSKKSMQFDTPTCQMFTLQFDAEIPLPPQLDVFKPVAVVDFFVNGTSVRRMFDCRSGASISGCAEHIEASVEDHSVTSGNTIPYNVSIIAAAGTRPSQNQPPTFQSFGNGGADTRQTLATGGTIDFEVPQNIGAISVFVALGPANPGDVIDPSDIIVEQRDATGAIVLISYDPRIGEFIPLAPGCVTIRARSGAGAPNNVLVTVTYGIDG